MQRIHPDYQEDETPSPLGLATKTCRRIRGPFQWGPDAFGITHPPAEIKSSAGRMKSVAISTLLNNYDIGGSV